MTSRRHGVNWVSVSLADKCGSDESTDKMGLGRFGRDICDAFPFFLFFFSFKNTRCILNLLHYDLFSLRRKFLAKTLIGGRD